MAPQAASNIAYAMATFRYKDEPALSSLAAWSLPRLHLFSATELADLLWAMASLNVRNDALLRGALKVWPRHVQQFNKDAATLQRGAAARAERLVYLAAGTSLTR